MKTNQLTLIQNIDGLHTARDCWDWEAAVRYGDAALCQLAACGLDDGPMSQEIRPLVVDAARKMVAERNAPRIAEIDTMLAHCEQRLATMQKLGHEPGIWDYVREIARLQAERAQLVI